MAENPLPETAAEPIAIVGMACRFPEAAGLAELLELVVTGRRAFRRVPPVRLDPGDYSLVPGLPAPARAGLIEGWTFDRAAFGVTQPAYRAADPAHWLALEMAARALADGGFPGGQGLTRDRTGVIIGNTLTGEVSRAAAMRSRWPYVRRVLRAALAAGEVPAEHYSDVLAHAASGFLTPLPESGDSLAGSLPGAIADRICGHYGFRGGGHAVDAAHSSSLLAVAAACSALAAGDLDAAIAGGVDISLDPFELAGLAATGVLASGEMRVYDARPTGFLPGEGCGLVVLMRAADARSAGVPSYAQIAGWGVSSAGNPALTKPGSASLLLALRRAYQRAHIDPADVQLIEGDGTGTASGDLAELTSIAELRQGAPALAALGSVKANIGHAKAAAGAAGLLKATLAISAGVIPPATGCVRPHPLVASEDARLRVPRTAEAWPARARLAGVSSVGPGGTSVHVVLRRTREGRRRRAPGSPGLRGGPGQSRAPGQARTAAPVSIVAGGSPRTEAFVFSAADGPALAAELTKVADVARWLSDGEFHDLACQAGRRDGPPGRVRAGLVAGTQDQLAQLARDAAGVLPGLRRGELTTAGDMYLADGCRGRVTLLFPGEGSPLAPATPGAASGALAAHAGDYDPGRQPGIVAASLTALRWLGDLGVTAAAAVGHGLGEITGLVWAGCLAEPDAARLVAQRAALMAAPSAERTAMVAVDSGRRQAQDLCARTGLVIAAYNGPRCHVLAGPVAAVGETVQRLAEDGVPARLLDAPHGFYSPAMADRAAPLRSVLREMRFQPPGRRLVSTVTAAELGADTDIASLLCTQLTAPVVFARALALAARGSDLLVETGPGDSLSRIAADCCEVPAVSLGAGRGDEEAAAHAAAALFAAGAVGTLRPLLSARAARPVDIWQERVFIPSPCGAPPLPDTAAATAAPAPRPDAAVASTGEPAPRTAAAVPAGESVPAAGTPARPPEPPGEPPAAWLGAGPWVRCFVAELRALQPPPDGGTAGAADGPWRLRLAAPQLSRDKAASVFADKPDAGTVLIIVGDPAEPGACAALLEAADQAQQAGSLVVITSSGGLTGFCASLHAERPSLGVTLIRAALTLEGLRAARPFAAATPGRFREIVLRDAAPAAESVMRLAEPAADGTFPLGPADVVLVSGVTRPGDLACATALASRGAALAVIAVPGPDDPRLTAQLAELRAAGARVSRKKADLTDPGQVAAAVRSLERGLGPVTAVVHAPAPGPVERCGRLTESALRSYLVGQRTRLTNVLSAVAADRLRLLITFGPVAARYGSVGGCCEALGGGLLAEHAARLAAARPRCRALHVDLAPWQEAGDVAARGGHAADAAPIPVADAAGLLLSLLTSSDLPSRVAVHGRLGAAARQALLSGPASRGGPREAGLGGRFLETVREYYPGVELVAETRLSLRADPYLADYRIDGLPVLPPTLALEAMAQAASALAGGPLRQAGEVRLAAPVVLPWGPDGGETVIRVCALSRDDEVETVLRCAATRFQVDHARAVFRAGGSARAGHAADGLRQRRPGTGAVSPGGIVDGTDLYGPVFFQTGRFRRVAFLPETSSRDCRALVRGGDTSPWFGPVPGPVDVPLILGSPGLNDATLQVLQACLPHRRLLPAGCDRVTFMGQEVRGALQVMARQRAASDEWDVVAVDATGTPVVAWAGLRLRDVGPLARTAAWHPALLANSVEARAAELGIDATLRAVISSGRSPLAGTAPVAADAALAEPGAPPVIPALTWTDTAPGRGPLDGFELRVAAARPVACRWEAATEPPGDEALLDEGLLRLRQQLDRVAREAPAARRSRFRAVAACLAALGREPGSPCELEDARDGGWVTVRAPGVAAACTVTAIAGVPAPVCLAIASKLVPAGPQHPPPSPGAADGEAMTANGVRP